MKAKNNIQATGIFEKSAKLDNFDYEGVIAILNDSQRSILRERIERAFTTARNVVETHRRVSAWEHGVRATAFDLIDQIEERVLYSFDNYGEFPMIDETFALNGAADWQQYSEGGCGSALLRNTSAATAVAVSRTRWSRGLTCRRAPCAKRGDSSAGGSARICASPRGIIWEMK